VIFLFFAFISLIYFQTVEAAPNFVSINSKKANSTLLDGTVDILDDKGKSLTKGKIREGLVFTGSASKAKKIRVDFSNAPITTIELDDVVIDDTGTIKENDALIFFNFREDSMRQLVEAFVDKEFDIFEKKLICQSMK